MQLCQRPAPLQPGDRLWVTLPSGPLRNRESFDNGIEVWRQRGYHVDLAPCHPPQWGYLAGTDTDRRLSLEQGLKDKQYRAVLCGRGGYGGARLLEQWQWPPVSKWLVGFSDVTSLLWSLAQTGVSGVHGPVLTTLADEPDWSVQRLFDWVEGRAIAPLKGTGWSSGTVTGKLLPANLTVATHLLGTAAQPDLSDVILAFEDVGEAPYRIDRMLTQWRMQGLLQSVCGIALGRFSDCDSSGNVSVEEVLRDRIGDLGVPVVADLPFGHQGVNAALPVGMLACLDSDQGSLTVLP
ncbi:MAG: LD-carboxypeptidase [Thermosynechococcaceae cyanobacterium]